MKKIKMFEMNFGEALVKLKSGNKVVPWLASQSDILANDWIII